MKIDDAGGGIQNLRYFFGRSAVLDKAGHLDLLGSKMRILGR